MSAEVSKILCKKQGRETLKCAYNISFSQWLSVTIAGSVMFFSGCSSTGSMSDAWHKTKNGDFGHLDAIDTSLGLTRDDYKHMGAPKKGEANPTLEIEKGAPPVPKIADILTAPRPPKIGESQIVSIAVTDDVPLKDVLIELAKLADIDIELDAGITGGITFIAKDKPFNEVIERISSLTGLRYTMKGGVLRVERDTPFIKSYAIDFLNVDRDSDSSVNLSTNVLSGGGSGGGGSSGGGSSGGGGGGGSSGGSGGGLTTGSTSSVKTKSAGDFWKSLEAGVQQILLYQETKHLSENVLQSEANVNSPAPTAAKGAPVQQAPLPQVNGAAPVVAAATVKSMYTLNRQAGVLTVNASNRQQELIERYINELKKNASAQVLIEAKIIEVDLRDQYASGINWQTVGNKIGQQIGIGPISTQFTIPTATDPIAGFNPATSFIQFTSSRNANDIMKLLEGFGTTRTLSSPRLHAINNQQSTLTFATNHVYFSLTITPATTTSVGGIATTPTAPTITSTINTVPIGIMMTLMPSIDVEGNEVTLAVRPTLSTIADFVNDPGFTLQLAQTAPALVNSVQNKIPEIQVRELDSTLKLKSGQTMVIGGLMQQESNNTDNGVPFIAGIPVIGNIFKNVIKENHNKELVLLIKATIVDMHGSLNNTDKNIFRKFSDDPRPVSF